jgi:hypothetical protein
MVCRVALVKTDVSEELSSSIIRVTRIGELGTTPAVTRNRLTLRRNTNILRFLVTVNVVPSSPILVTLMMEAIVLPKCRFLQETHGVTSLKAAFFVVTAVKTSNLTYHYPAGLYSGDVMCLLGGTNWVSISLKTSFIVTAVKTSNLT